MKFIKEIVRSTVEPGKNNLWLKNDLLWEYTPKGWTPLGITPEDVKKIAKEAVSGSSVAHAGTAPASIAMYTTDWAEVLPGAMSKVPIPKTGKYDDDKNYIEGTGYFAYAEGAGTLASGNSSHAEGSNTVASGASSHAEGGSTVASGFRSHAEGTITLASETASHAEGGGTIAYNAYMHVQGLCNEVQYDDNENPIHDTLVDVVAWGTPPLAGTAAVTKNIETTDQSGNKWVRGEVRAGGTSYATGSKLATEAYVDSAIPITAAQYASILSRLDALESPSA